MAEGLQSTARQPLQQVVGDWGILGYFLSQ